MAGTTDYTGRSIDLLIFQGVEESGSQQVSMAFGDTGYICTGIQKLAQKWTILFLADVGSKKYWQTEGTDILNAIRNSNIRTSQELIGHFNDAAFSVAETLTGDPDYTALEDDERLSRADLVNYVLDREGGYLYLKVNLVSVSGNSREIKLPIPVVIK